MAATLSLQGTLQCVAVCCSVLQCVAVLHPCEPVAAGHVAVCCSVLQCSVVCCSVASDAAVMAATLSLQGILQCDAVCCSVLQRVAAS